MVHRLTCKILAICVIGMPFSNKVNKRFLFLESFKALDLAPKGRPSFFPLALRRARLSLMRSCNRDLDNSADRLNAKAKTLL